MTARRRRQKRRSLPLPESPRRGSARLALVLFALVGVNLYVFLLRGGTSIPDVMERASVADESEFGAADDSDFDPEAVPTQETAEEEELPESEEEFGGSVIEGEVASGDSLGRILQREGLDANTADAIIRGLRPVMDLRKIRPGQEYSLELNSAGQITAFEYRLSRIEKVVARPGASGFTAELVQAATEKRIHEVGGTIESSLAASMERRGEDPSLVAFFVDVFAYDLNFYIDQHAGDTFRMLVEKEYLNGEFLRYGRVLAAEYSGKAGTYRAFWWKFPGARHGSYFDNKGRSITKTFLKTPLKYARVSSRFNPRRMHPVLHVRRGHWGVDYAAPTGTPVWSAAPGKIVFRGRRGGAGNAVIVKHDNGYTTIYMHLSKFRRGQRVGQRVRQKDVIGYVGATGLATGPHLHFGVKKNGKYVDPSKIKMTRGPGVPKAHLSAYRAHVTAQAGLLAGVDVGASTGAGAPAEAVAPTPAP